MIIALLAATVLMADSTPAMQAAPTTTAAPNAQATSATAPENAKPKKEGSALICRNEPTLGTRLPTKKCRTAEQIAQQRLEDQADLDKMQRRDEPGH
jgi:hypothetical protein